jgi:hypothetical protein
MNWTIGYSEIITLMFLGATLMYFRELSGSSKIRGVLRAALRRADVYGKTGRDTVRIDRNQAAELLGVDVDPRRGEKFTGKFDGIHPNMRSAARRKKLRK